MTKTRIISLLLFIIFSMGFGHIFGQGPYKKTKNQGLKHWEINVNAGLFSYYGDISGHDNNYGGKLSEESSLAGGLILSKNLSSEVKLSGQLIVGKLKGRKDNYSVTSEVLEYNIQARFDILKIANVTKLQNLRWDIYAGIGNFLFNTTLYEYIEGTTNVYKTESRVPEFLYLFGTSLSYNISPKIAISTDLSLRQCQNDKVDNVVANNNFDYYSYLNIGISYKIFRINKDIDSRAKYSHYNGNGKSIYRSF